MNKRISYTKYAFKYAYLIAIIILLYACKSSKSLQYVNIDAVSLTDAHAAKNTKLLYQKIKILSQKGIAIGHQDATAYGVNWRATKKDPLKSDINDVTGKFPAIYGWDVGHIELGKDSNLDGVPFDLMRKQIRKTYRKGGINTISWHVSNPATDGSSWDTIAAVPSILPGGVNRSKYEVWVQKLGTFIRSLKTWYGKPIPIVFRPYHEMNGSWFWWGTEHCSVDEYKQLYTDLVHLLQQHKVHNVLYAWSPNTLNNNTEYALYYPGDAHVDLLGIDIYNHSGDSIYTQKLKNDIAIMRKFSIARNKPYALTEAGNIKPEDPNWWTEVLYPGIQNSGIAWVLFWRNWKEKHYFAPYPSESSSENFKAMGAKEDILFLEELEKYRFKIRRNTK